MSSVFEQKRHYEQEIEVLKQDLEVIEQEEHRIKLKLYEKTSISHNDHEIKVRTALKDRSNKIEQDICLRLNEGPINIAFDSFLEKKASEQPYMNMPYKEINVINNSANSEEAPQPRANIHEPITTLVSKNALW